MNPEIEYEAEVTVNESPAKSWKVFTDTTKMSDWVLNFKSIETIKETPEKVGSKYLLTVVDDGEEYEMTETVTSYITEKYYSLLLENDMLINNVDYSFEALGDKTRIITTHKLKGKDILMKAIFPLMKGMFIDQASEDLEKLKGLIERS